MKYLFVLFLPLFILGCTPSSAPTQNDPPPDFSPSALFTTQKISGSPAQGATPSMVLTNIKTTGRISSNHYSDFVVDRQGNSYIACFEKKADNQDYILITKVAPNGDILWESGNDLKGRATAISIDEEGRIWVLGVLSDGLPTSDQKSCMFIARFDAEGHCQQLITNEGSGLGFNIHVNNKNEILIAGIMGNTLSFGDARIEKASGEDQGFLARFNQNGRCLWIKDFTATVQRIRSDSKGDFYLCGDFHQQLIFEGDTLTTTDRFDSDGFVLKVPRNDRHHWLRQFGQKGVIQYGYATRETGADLIIDENDQILVCAMMNLKTEEFPEKERRQRIDMALQQYDTDGKLLDQTILAHHLTLRSIHCLALDQNGDLWVSGHARPGALFMGRPLSLEQEQQTFLLHLNSDKTLKKVVLPTHDTNMTFRVANAWEDRVLFSGHFQNRLSIKDQTVTNNGEHGLFLLNMKINK